MQAARALCLLLGLGASSATLSTPPSSPPGSPESSSGSDDCSYMCIQLAENGDCDEPCNTPGCSFDGGDCADPDDGPDWRECLADSSCTREWLGDGFCDPSCNTPECDQDDGDCDQCRDCPEEWLGDGTCDPQCNTVRSPEHATRTPLARGTHRCWPPRAGGVRSRRRRLRAGVAMAIPHVVHLAHRAAAHGDDLRTHAETIPRAEIRARRARAPAAPAASVEPRRRDGRDTPELLHVRRAGRADGRSEQQEQWRRGGAR